MKKAYFVLTAAILLTAGCGSGVSKEDYNQLATQASELQAELDERNSGYAEMESNYNEISLEYDAYKESMQGYEGLSEAEATARRIEAESIAAAEAASIEAAKAAEEESKAAEAAAIAASIAEEEARGYETGISYEQLARTPDDFVGQKVKFSGKVVQVMEGDGTVEIRLSVNSDYNTVLYGSYSSSIVSSRVLEDDIITIYGTSKGLLSYQSTMGGTITIPHISIDKIDQ